MTTDTDRREKDNEAICADLAGIIQSGQGQTTPHVVQLTGTIPPADSRQDSKQVDTAGPLA